MPLLNGALAFARLADPSGLPARRANALRTVFYAMTAYPEMVRGPGGLDTEMMRRRPHSDDCRHEGGGWGFNNPAPSEDGEDDDDGEGD